MGLFGLTFVSTKKQKDIELRKWCVEKSMWCRGCDIPEYAELLYRYIAMGDTAIFEDSRSGRKRKKKTSEVKPV